MDTLEPRRLLTYTLSATPAADLIEITQGAANFTIDIFVNNTLAGTTGDNDVRISGLGGDDQFVMRRAVDHSSSIFDIKMIGGPGDDRYDLGEGKFTAVHFFGIVRLEEVAGEGNDRLFVDNSSSAGGVAHPNIRTDRISDAFFDEHVELKQINFSNADDNVVVEGVPAGLRLELNGGTNSVTFGGAGKKVANNLAAGAVVGGPGTDKVVFDDSNGDGNVNRDYPISASGMLNQAFTGIEQGEIKVRRNITGTRNSVIMTGGGNVDALKLSGSALMANDTGPRLLVGTQASPIDLDNLALQLTASWESNQPPQYEIWHESNFTADPFLLDGVNNQQIVQKGFFTARLANGNFGMGLKVASGAAADVFHVRDVLPGSGVAVTGGFGNDTLLTLPDTGHNNAPQNVFVGSNFSFDGGGDDDALFLDDSLAPVGDGVAMYDLFNAYTKRGQTYLTYRSVDRIHFTADAGNNTIHFNTRLNSATAFETRYVIDGGAGNDVISNYVPDANGGALSAVTSATILGGAGNDIFAVDDTLIESHVVRYNIDQNSISYQDLIFPGGQFLYDSSMEQIELNQGVASAETFFNSKRAAASLVVTLGGGDDTITVGGGDIDGSGISSATATLLGGSGEDLIVFDDRFDDHGPLDNDAFTFFPQQVNKDGTTIVYSGFESQKLITSGVNTSGVAAPNKVRVNAAGIPTEIAGSAGVRNNTVDINAGANIGLLAAPITLSFDDAPVVVSVNDQSALAARQFAFSPSQMSLPFVVNYSGVEELYVYAGASNDAFNVAGSPEGTTLFLNGGNGDETYNLGTASGAFADLAGRVFAAGGSGIDRVVFTNGANGGFTDGVLASGGLRANGGPNHLYQCDVVSVVLNDAGSNIGVTSLSASAGIGGGGGDDLVTVGGGDLDVNILGTLFMRGGGGLDRLVIDDSNGTNQPGTPAEYKFDVFNGTAGPVDRLNAFITCLEVERRQFDASDDANVINVVDSVGELILNASGGDDAIAVTDATGVVTVDTGDGLDRLTVNADAGTAGDGPVTVLFDQSDEVNYLDLRAGGTLRVAEGATLLKTAVGAGIALVVSGTIDLAGGSMLFREASNVPNQSSVRDLISRGRNGGTWDGTSPLGAINSSAAAASPAADGVGHGTGGDLAVSSIGPFAVNAGDTVIGFAHQGDGDMSGSVDIGDFARLAANFNRPTQNWAAGDYNYDGSTDIADFSALAANFNQSQGRTPLTALAEIRTPSIVTFSNRLIDGLKDDSASHHRRSL